MQKALIGPQMAMSPVVGNPGPPHQPARRSSFRLAVIAFHYVSPEATTSPMVAKSFGTSFILGRPRDLYTLRRAIRLARRCCRSASFRVLQDGFRTRRGKYRAGLGEPNNPRRRHVKSASIRRQFRVAPRPPAVRCAARNIVMPEIRRIKQLRCQRWHKAPCRWPYVPDRVEDERALKPSSITCVTPFIVEACGRPQSMRMEHRDGACAVPPSFLIT